MPPRRLAAGSWCAELLSRNSYSASYKPTQPIIGFAFDSQTGVHAFGSDRIVDFHARPNGLAYVPKDCDVYSRSEVGGEYLKIAFRPDHDETLPLRHFSNVMDAAAIDAANQLRRGLLAPHGFDLLQCERSVRILRDRVALALCTPSRATASWMTPRRLRLVDELIEARLATRLTVEEIAEVLGLSAGFFCRAFRGAVGKAPHDHIVDRRVARARSLLQSGNLDLSAVAYATGFSSHAHMTATFRKRLGITPSALRRHTSK